MGNVDIHFKSFKLKPLRVPHPILHNRKRIFNETAWTKIMQNEFIQVE